MSDSIWKMPDQKPDIFQAHRVLVIYEAHDEPELMLSTQYEAYTTDRYINRWCYLDTLIAQADKAERLQKAVDLIANMEQRICIDDPVDILDDVLKIAKDEIKQLIKGKTNDK